MRRLWYYYIYLLIVWGGFRYFVRLPEIIEELWFKPVLWLVPLFWWQVSMKDRVVMFKKSWFLSVFLGIVVGSFYFILIRRFSLWGIRFDQNLLGIVLATAITEELVFSGFIAGYLDKIQKGKEINFLIVGLMVAIIRLPILMFIYRLGIGEMVGVFLFSGASGIINAWIRMRTGNVAGSIIARVGMNLAILG